MSDRTGLAIEVVGASIANKVTGAGAVTGTVGWLVDINWIGLVGVVIAVLGLLVNTYFQIRKDRRETAESAARIEQLRDRCRLDH